MSITTTFQEGVRSSGVDYKAGIPERYWELVDQYREELLNQAYSLLGSRDDAEDVVQETFCEAFRDATKIAGESIGASLRLINKCNALNRIRANGRARKRTEQKQQNAPTRAFTTGGFSGIEVRETVNTALDTLPANLRQVVVLRYWEHLSYKEIAARLNIPVGAVGPLLSEASIRLFPKLAAHLRTEGERGKGQGES
jgi:RNA polymerase sigma-70 factor, ECF subfamily